MERKAAQQNKNLSEELKQGLPRIAQVSNAGGITLTFPLATECAHLRLKCFYLLQDSHYSNNMCWRHGAHILTLPAKGSSPSAGTCLVWSQPLPSQLHLSTHDSVLQHPLSGACLECHEYDEICNEKNEISMNASK